MYNYSTMKIGKKSLKLLSRKDKSKIKGESL